MKTASKKLLSLLLAVVMVVSILPIAAFAECDHADPVTAKDATCTEKGYHEGYYQCPDCKKYFSDDTHDGDKQVIADDVEIPAQGHNMPLTHHEAKAATCTEAGNNEYWTCETCSNAFTDEAGSNPTTATAETIGAFGHSMTHTEAKTATCKEDGNSEYWTCSVCSKVYSDAAGTTETSVADRQISKDTIPHTPNASNVCTTCGKPVGGGTVPDSVVRYTLNGVSQTVGRNGVPNVGAAPSWDSWVSAGFVGKWTTPQWKAVSDDKAHDPGLAIADYNDFYANIEEQKVRLTIVLQYVDDEGKTVNVTYGDKTLTLNQLYGTVHLYDKTIVSYMNEVEANDIDNYIAANSLLSNGYVRDGNWYVGDTKLGSQKFTGQVTVTAKLVKKGKVTISFNLEGLGYWDPEKNYNKQVDWSKTYKDNLPTPKRDGYKFVGWYTVPQSTYSGTYSEGSYKYDPDQMSYFTKATKVYKDTQVYAHWIPEANVEVYLYTSTKGAYSLMKQVSGLSVGDKISANTIKALVSNTTNFAGPFDQDGNVTADANDNWSAYVADAATAKSCIPVEGLTLNGTTTYRFAVYAPKATSVKDVSTTINSYANSVTITPNNSAYAGNSSTSNADPSNPKTGDAARVGIPAAQTALVTSGVALMALAAAAFVQKKKEQM